MNDIISTDAAHPQWRQICDAAELELDPEKLLVRIADARTAVLSRFEGDLPDLSREERLALHDALDLLLVLQDIARREIGEQKRAAMEQPEERVAG